MSDKDTAHTLTELQEARAEIDRLREVVLEYKRQAAQLVERVVQLDDYMRWRKASAERPEPMTDCVVILGNKQYADAIRYLGDGDWSTGIITYWRPIGPLPKENE